MTSQPSVLLLIGSAKPQGRSTSESLGRYLCDRLAQQGGGLHTLYVHNTLRTEARTQAMLAAVDAADILILAAPLYVDSLPYLVTDALERIAAHRAVMPSGSTQTPRFAAILNCGFPEAQHNDVALAICEQFAEAAGLQWAGGMSMGGGGVVHGVPLAEHGPRAAGVRRALNIAADALAEGHRVPDAAISMLAQPVIPARMYTTIGNLGWHRTARRHGTRRRLYDRPLAG